MRDSEQGIAGLEEVDRVIDLVGGQAASGGLHFAPNLVRGLNYYTGPIWEVTVPAMAGSIASGGRYDNLISHLGGPNLPACGGSLGIDRILELLPQSVSPRPPIQVAVTVLDEKLASECFKITTRLRRADVIAAIYLGDNRRLTRQLQWAGDQRARFALLYGSNEASKGIMTVRDMISREQAEVSIGEIVPYIADRLATAHDQGTFS